MNDDHTNKKQVQSLIDWIMESPTINPLIHPISDTPPQLSKFNERVLTLLSEEEED